MAVQLEHGYDFNEFVGTFVSPPALAIKAGTFMKIATADAVDVAAGEATADGKYILLQDVTLDGPTYQEIVNRVIKHVVKAGDPVAVFPVKAGVIIKTDVIATGADVGAITAVTPFGTELGLKDGVLRAAQAGDVKVGRLIGTLDTQGMIKVELY